MPCTTAARLTTGTLQNGTQANKIVTGKIFVQKVSLMGNPEPHPNSGSASSLVQSMFPHQKVLSMEKIVNHTPTMGMQAAL